MRAVAALVAGRGREDAAAVFGVSPKAVDGWWAKWQAGGREAPVMQPRGKPVGVHQVLGEAEQAAVRQAALDHRSCDVGLSGQLWTRRLVGELIAKLYRLRLTEPGMGKCPGPRSVHRRRRTAARSCSPTRSASDPTRSLAAPEERRGKTPVVRRTGNRLSANAMSAISAKGRMHFMVLPSPSLPR